jgi:hypothetical protein
VVARIGRKDDSQEAKHGGNYSGDNQRGESKSPRGGGNSQASGKDPRRSEHRRHR